MVQAASSPGAHQPRSRKRHGPAGQPTRDRLPKKPAKNPPHAPFTPEQKRGGSGGGLEGIMPRQGLPHA